MRRVEDQANEYVNETEGELSLRAYVGVWADGLKDRWLVGGGMGG